MPKAAMTVLLDDAGERVLMIWRHRFMPDCWTWELPGGYVDPDEDPTAAREVELLAAAGLDLASSVRWVLFRADKHFRRRTRPGRNVRKPFPDWVDYT